MNDLSSETNFPHKNKRRCMSTPEEPSQSPAETDPETEIAETVSLVDLFDQLDRASFRRALKQRDSAYPYSNRQS